MQINILKNRQPLVFHNLHKNTNFQNQTKDGLQDVLTPEIYLKILI